MKSFWTKPSFILNGVTYKDTRNLRVCEKRHPNTFSETISETSEWVCRYSFVNGWSMRRRGDDFTARRIPSSCKSTKANNQQVHAKKHHHWMWVNIFWHNVNHCSAEQLQKLLRVLVFIPSYFLPFSFSLTLFVSVCCWQRMVTTGWDGSLIDLSRAAQWEEGSLLTL